MSDSNPTDKLLEAALSYAERGWRVFPLKPESKEPATKRGFKDAKTDAKQIRRWWSGHAYNIGIATGNGLLVIDLDVDDAKGEDGTVTLRKWELGHGELPETACVKTGSGGTHLYFRCDDNIHISTNPAAGVDIRCDGGYVVAPPSVHPGSGRYEWDLHPDEVGVARADANVMGFVEYVQGSRKRKRLDLPAVIPEGQRNDTLMRYGASMQAQRYDDDVICSTLETVNDDRCVPPLPEAEVRKICESVLSYPKGRSDEVPETGGNSALILDANGKPKDLIENCRRILDVDVDLADRFYYDQFAYTRMCVPPLPWDRDGKKPRKVRDSDYIGFTAYLENSYKKTFTKTKATDAVILTSESNARNPLRDWLESLEWDGTERMDMLLPTFLGADNTDYVVAVTRVLLFGAVARIFRPGVKFDYMPILIGPQGIGKTLLTRLLAHSDDWHLANLPTVDSKKAPELMRGKWIVEVQELLTKKEDVNDVKAFVTTQIDTYRAPYGRETDDRPRMSVLIGTTNDLQPLHDKTGNRRFLPVMCGAREPARSLRADDSESSRDVIASLQPEFDQVWAEAVSKWRSESPSLVLDGRIEKFAEAMQESFMEDDSREGLIERFLDTKLGEARLSLSYDRMNVRVCVSDVIDHALMEDQRRGISRKALEGEIHEIMAEMGDWEPYCNKAGQKGKLTCGDYGRQRCYIPKE